MKYLLHGQNGTGKSTILKALKGRLIPGVPSNVVISLLQQREGDNEHDEESAERQGIVLDEGISALDLVVQSDEARTKALARRESQSSLSITYHSKYISKRAEFPNYLSNSPTNCFRRCK